MAAGHPLAVDRDHLGTPETGWSSCSALRSAPALPLPWRPRVVVVAPHPDDEVLGVGGLLQVLGGRIAPGRPGAEPDRRCFEPDRALLEPGDVVVEVCAVTDGEASHPGLDREGRERLRRIRAAESTAAVRRLGFDDVRRHRLGHPDGGVGPRQDELAEELGAMLGPDTVCLAPWRHDGHPDHDAAGAAAAIAARATGAVLVEYLVWAWHWASPEGDEIPWARARRVELTRRQTARKRWATQAFPSQIRPSLSSPSGSSSDGPTAVLPVLPAPVLRRFWRPFEVVLI